MNRLNRDQVIIRALDLLDSAVLDNHDRPAGSIVAGAFSIGWLQEALDYFHKKFPFSADIKSASISVVAGDTTEPVPSDFILDYGIVWNDDNGNSLGRAGRMTRKGLGYIINVPTNSSGSRPTVYCIRGSTIEFRNKADKAYTGTLWYYGLPAVIGASDIPIFPDDHILTEYVRLKGQEYHRLEKPGTALAYADARIKELQNSGIGNEAEEDQFGIDPTYVGGVSDPNAWMGRSSL